MSTPSASRRAVRALAVAAAATAAIGLAVTAAPASVIAGPVVNPANGHAYYLLSQNVWTASETEAVALGGHLATINNGPENRFVYSTFAAFGGVNRNLWIGMYDPDPTVNAPGRAARRAEFGWVSGEPVTFTAWSPVEPNNPTSNDATNPELYVHIWNPSDPNAEAWNNYYDANVEFGLGNHGVVEVVPEPAGAVAVAAGGLACLRRRRR